MQHDLTVFELTGQYVQLRDAGSLIVFSMQLPPENRYIIQGILMLVEAQVTLRILKPFLEDYELRVLIDGRPLPSIPAYRLIGGLGINDGLRFAERPSISATGVTGLGIAVIGDALVECVLDGPGTEIPISLVITMSGLVVKASTPPLQLQGSGETNNTL